MLSQVYVAFNIFYHHVVHVDWFVVYNHHLCLCDDPDLPSIPIKQKIFRFLGVFGNLPLSRFILKFFRFLLTILVTANKIDIHVRMLLFSTSFVISVLCGDVETENRLILCHREIKYR